jgi:hypothetical protein
MWYGWIIAIALLLLALLLLAVRVVKQYEQGHRGPAGRADPDHPVHRRGITKDNVSVDVSAVAYFRVVDAVKSVVAIENVAAAINQSARTTCARSSVSTPWSTALPADRYGTINHTGRAAQDCFTAGRLVVDLGHEYGKPGVGLPRLRSGRMSGVTTSSGSDGHRDEPARVQRDRDDAGRPRNARPRDGLGRPLPPGTPGVPTIPDDVSLAPAETLREAQRLLDAGLPFHAHEVLEAAWKAAPDGERELWRGLAQLAVGLTHARRGNTAGASRLLRRSADRIEPYAGSPPHPVAVADLTAWARNLAARIDAIGTVDLPSIATVPRLS